MADARPGREGPRGADRRDPLRGAVERLREHPPPEAPQPRRAPDRLQRGRQGPQVPAGHPLLLRRPQVLLRPHRRRQGRHPDVRGARDAGHPQRRVPGPQEHLGQGPRIDLRHEGRRPRRRHHRDDGKVVDQEPLRREGLRAGGGRAGRGRQARRPARRLPDLRGAEGQAPRDPLRGQHGRLLRPPAHEDHQQDADPQLRRRLPAGGHRPGHPQADRLLQQHRLHGRQGLRRRPQRLGRGRPPRHVRHLRGDSVQSRQGRVQGQREAQGRRPQGEDGHEARPALPRHRPRGRPEGPPRPLLVARVHRRPDPGGPQVSRARASWTSPTRSRRATLYQIGEINVERQRADPRQGRPPRAADVLARARPAAGRDQDGAGPQAAGGDGVLPDEPRDGQADRAQDHQPPPRQPALRGVRRPVARRDRADDLAPPERRRAAARSPRAAGPGPGPAPAPGGVRLDPPAPGSRFGAPSAPRAPSTPPDTLPVDPPAADDPRRPAPEDE